MAKTNFVSGKLRLAVTYNDRTDQYNVKICGPEHGAAHCENVKVGIPGAGPRSSHGRRIAVDDPRAMMQAARAAISFASDDFSNYAEYDRRLTHAIVRPPRRLFSRKKRSR